MKEVRDAVRGEETQKRSMRERLSPRWKEKAFVVGLQWRKTSTRGLERKGKADWKWVWTGSDWAVELLRSREGLKVKL